MHRYKWRNNAYNREKRQILTKNALQNFENNRFDGTKLLPISFMKGLRHFKGFYQSTLQ